MFAKILFSSFSSMLQLFLSRDRLLKPIQNVPSQLNSLETIEKTVEKMILYYCGETMMATHCDHIVTMMKRRWCWTRRWTSVWARRSRRRWWSRNRKPWCHCPPTVITSSPRGRWEGVRCLCGRGVWWQAVAGFRIWFPSYRHNRDDLHSRSCQHNSEIIHLHHIVFSPFQMSRCVEMHKIFELCPNLIHVPFFSGWAGGIDRI